MATSVPRIRPARHRDLTDRHRTAFRSGVWYGPLLVVLTVLTATCATTDEAQRGAIAASTVTTDGSTSTTSSTAAQPTAPAVEATTGTSPLEAATEQSRVGPASPAPDWLGTRVLPTLPDGTVVTPQTTPPELIDRRLITEDLLPPPTGEEFEHTIQPLPAEVAARSTWNDGCPVALDELSYLTMSFWGFDGLAHTGEMIVHAEVAADIVTVFAALFEARFPMEEMRVTAPAELNAEPTGDGNNTTAFVCRAVTGGSRFSEHAYGLAIDVNPFHNPYQRGDVVLPELAGSYLDRDAVRPGMVIADDPVVSAFAAIGWSWGGRWQSLKDYQHFTLNNR